MVVIPPVISAVPAALVTVLCCLLSLRSFELSSLVTLNLLLVMHPLYYWCVFRPSLFPAWAAFLLGFTIDLVTGRLLGLNAFLLVMVSLVILRQRRYLLSQPFATQWAAFLLLCLSAEGLRWAVMVAVTMTPFSPASALTSAGFNAALYPITALVMLGCLRLISPRSNSETLG